MNISTLRPGLLVSLKTSIRGNVSYAVDTIDPDYLDESGARRAKWQTERVVADPREHERAVRVRSTCRSLVIRHCASSSFGLLCPERNEAFLRAAIEEAQAEVRAFNEEAALTRIGFYVLIGRVAADDAEAVRAIGAEMRELMSDMESGIEGLNAEAVRSAAKKARALGNMLSDDAASRVADAIGAARGIAREIVKAGEGVAFEIDRAALRQITEARTAFLDLDAGGEFVAPATVGRGVDLYDLAAATGEPVAATREVDLA
jgi:hypothetical protein